MLRFPSPAPVPPMSNRERQRLFQARHPGYDARRKATLRASLKRSSDQKMAELAKRLRAEALTAAGSAPPDANAVPIECGMI